MKHLKSQLTLPCGTILQNRIAKSAMSENLGTAKHQPTNTLVNAYRVWGKGEAGLLITGNIMIDSRAIGEARNVVVEDRSDFELLKEWAATTKGTKTQLWTQINHPGRQALPMINKKIVAPSAVEIKIGGRSSATDKIPIALTEPEIYEIIDRFANTALILKEAGFDGVQIHGAHGYLVSQFLSPYTNIRTDQWGGSIENRARFVLEVYRKMRAVLGDDYPIGIKLNSADFQRGGFSESDSMEVIKMLSSEGIDLIEISGGSYESPAMMGDVKKSTQKREAYFMDFIEKARDITTIPLMLTGGFRTVEVMETALASNKLDIIGLARPFALYPYLAKDIFTKKETVFKAIKPSSGVQAIDNFGIELIWYEAQIKRIGQGKIPKFNLGAFSIFFKYAWNLMAKAFKNG